MNRSKKYSDSTPINSTVKRKYDPRKIYLCSHAKMEYDPLKDLIEYVVDNFKDGVFSKGDIRNLIRSVKTLREFVTSQGALDDPYPDPTEDRQVTLGQYFDWAESQLKSV